MTRVSIDAGLLQMIRNGLERDVAEGKTIRAEWLEEIERDAKPISEQSAYPVRLTDEEINAVHKDCEASYVPGSLVAFETFFAWGVEAALLHKLGINDRPAGGGA